jgi:hypothetical protein
VPARDRAAFAAFVRAGFGSGLRVPRRAALAHGISVRPAARDLTPRQWAALFRSIRGSR